MDSASVAELPTVATIIGCPEQLSVANGLVATPLGVPGTIGGSGPDDPIHKAILENLCGGFIPKKDRDLIFCDICNVSCNGDQPYNSHISGTKHAKKLKDQEMGNDVIKEPFIYEDRTTKTYECTLCQAKLNAKNQIAAHVAGTKHKNRLALNEKIYSAAPHQVPYCQDYSAHLLYCPTCDVHANSTLQMEQHMTSAKHVNKVNGTGMGHMRRPFGVPGSQVSSGRFVPYPFKERPPFFDKDPPNERHCFRMDRNTNIHRGCNAHHDRNMDDRFPEGRRSYNDNRSYFSHRSTGIHYSRESRHFGDRPLNPHNRYGPVGCSF